MILRPTLQVLAEAAEIGLPETATVPANAYDPILRPFIVKRVKRAIAEAEAKTTSKHADHMLRLAFLLALPAPPPGIAPEDERAVLTAFRALAAPYLPDADAAQAPAPAPPVAGAYRTTAPDREEKSFDVPKRRKPRWPLTTPIALVLLFSALGGVGAFLYPRLMPSPFARFKKTPFGQALGEPFTSFATMRDGEGEPEVLTPAVAKQLGKEASSSFEGVLVAARAARTNDAESADDALAPLFKAVNEENAALAKAKIPAALHAYGSGVPGHRAIWVTAYFVDRRQDVAIEGETHHFLWGRRLDSLNLEDHLIYKATAEDNTILSLDRLEREFVQTYLGPLAKGYPLAPDDWSNGRSSRAELSRVAGTTIADELVKVTKVTRADADDLHRAILQRNEIAVSLNGIGYRLPITSGIEVSDGIVKRMEKSKERHGEDAALLEDFLRANGRAASHRRDVAAAITALGSLEEEEFTALLVEQKRLAEGSLPVLGRAGESARGRAFASSSLGLLARERGLTKLALWRMVQPLFRQGYGYADRAAAVGALTALFHELGLAAGQDVSRVSDMDEDTMKELVRAFEMPSPKVKEAAATAFQKVFGHPAPPAVRTDR